MGKDLTMLVLAFLPESWDSHRFILLYGRRGVQAASCHTWPPKDLMMSPHLDLIWPALIHQVPRFASNVHCKSSTFWAYSKTPKPQSDRPGQGVQRRIQCSVSKPQSGLATEAPQNSPATPLNEGKGGGGRAR